jgi:hypothetical protein
MSKKRSEQSNYRLVGCGPYVEGDWSFYEVVLDGSNSTGRTVVGIVSKRSGGGWIATLPVFGQEGNGLRDVRVKVGTALGRGQTPAEALEEADKRAVQGFIGQDELIQKGFD